MKVHHIGIIVKEFKPLQDLFVGMGGKVICKDIAKRYNAICVFIDMGNVIIELVKSKNKNQPKEGLNHIAFYGKGKYDGAMPNMKVDFKIKNNIIIEEVEFEKNERN
ncbi:hypothetical protein CEE44_02205 [Candidatus Woesearchaeota archaeon B3_Woes]|nr:MAG: hypothetical protein CEE44_02205 [Candidatus Woesearchaeota archaeon B3_Woes]